MKFSFMHPTLQLDGTRSKLRVQPVLPTPVLFDPALEEPIKASSLLFSLSEFPDSTTTE